MDAQAHPGRTRHQSLRAQARALGLKNSFLGANELVLETVVALRQRGFRTPAVFTTKTSHVAAQLSDYQALLQQVSVEQLSEAFPSEAWNDFTSSGWAALPMPDSILDKRFLHICTLSSMADLGVTPTRADTYLNGEGHAGYDSTMGWLRNPATTPNAAFVATHPTTYRLTVGFMARQLLRAGMSSTACAHCVHSVWVELLWSCAPVVRARVCAGWADDINTVRACVELTLQVYNSKLALPNAAVRQFAHTDGEFMAEGFGRIPAPQCAALTSPSQCNGQRLYRFRFYDLSTETVHIEHTHTHMSKARAHTQTHALTEVYMSPCRRRELWASFGALRRARPPRQRSP